MTASVDTVFRLATNDRHQARISGPNSTTIVIPDLIRDPAAFSHPAQNAPTFRAADPAAFHPHQAARFIIHVTHPTRRR